MKLILSILLMAPLFASASTEIIYNRSANPYVPAQGPITSDHICVDDHKDAIQIYVPERSLQTCTSVKTDYTNPAHPRQICVGGQNVKVPATTLTAPRVTKKEVCVEWNRNDSAHPICTKTEIQDVVISDEYTQYTYDQSDYRKERPIDVREMRLEKCSQ